MTEITKLVKQMQRKSQVEVNEAPAEDEELIPVEYDQKDTHISASTLLIPTGSVMLNLACSDRFRGGYKAGRMVNLIGDSSSGKSFMAFTMIAQMVNDPLFDNYRFIYDDVEQACDFDIPKLFGKQVSERIEPPAYNSNTPVYSDTIQDFQMHLFDALGEGKKPFIYVLDSFDALTSKEEQVTTTANIEALRKGTKTAGSYGMEKPKIVGRILRMIVSGMKASDSFLLIISQTRDEISMMSFATKTRSGGRALKFYASHEIWLAEAGGLKKTSKGVELSIGGNVAAKVTKNKLTGKRREAKYPIYYDYGIDDLSPAIDFLLTTKYWELKKQTIVAPEFNIECTREKLIRTIEERGEENKLFAILEKQWQEVEKGVMLQRKPKFCR